MNRQEQAILLASKGFYIFPLEEGDKVPRNGFAWREKSTRDVERVKRWFQPDMLGRIPDPNIGIDCGKSGIYVIDVDVKKDKRGDVTLADLEAKHGLTPTFEVRTASGGKHLYYRDTNLLRNTAEKLGQGIDTRGVGGYVVAAGSEVGGQIYSVVAQNPIAPLDAWVAQSLSAYAVRSDAGKGSSISEDDEGNIERAIAWLQESAAHAVEGAAGDATTYSVAAMLKDLGCSEDTALQLLLDHWNEECSPPWELDDLQAKVAHAYRYGQNAIGSASAEAEFDMEALPAPAEKHPREASALARFDVNAIPPREWVFGDLALSRVISAIAAPPGAGKSTFLLTMALSKVTGRPLLNIDPIERGAVWVYNNEDDLQEMQRRLGAIMQHFGIAWDELFTEDVEGQQQRPLLYVNSGEEERFRIAKKNDHGEIKPLDMKWAIRQIQEKSIKLMVVDPFISTHPAKENDNDEIEKVADMYRRIAQTTGCAIVLVHHTKKRDEASSDGHEGNLDTLRGASALSGVVRIAATLFGMSQKRAKENNIADTDRWRYVGLMMAKANMSAATSEVRWFKKFGERIGVRDIGDEGEEIGVIRPIDMTTVSAGAMLDANKELVYDIEAACAGGDKPLAALCAELVEAFPFQQGKRPKSLEKAIVRLFDNGELSFTGKDFTLSLVRKESSSLRGPRHVLTVCCTPFSLSPEQEEELL